MGRKKMAEGTTQAAKREVKGLPRLGPEELSMYGSGDGSLSFVWQRFDHDVNSRVAIGRPVTMEDARRFISDNERGFRLVSDGWRLWAGPGLSGPFMVAPIERTGSDRIKMGDREYVYHINMTDPFFLRDGEIRQVALSLTYQTPAEEVEEYGVADVRTVRNIGTLASVAFFLNHEKGLTETPPESFTYEVGG